MATNTAKNHEIYVCSHCGATSVQWLGNCPKCGQWNTYAQEARTSTPLTGRVQSTGLKAVPLAQAEEETARPFSCGHPALDHLLGAGLVPGSVLLLGGEPGIGKSTLLLQVAGRVAKEGRKVLYASGEETLAQVRARAERLNVLHDNVLAIATSSCDDVASTLTLERPALLVLDSVQTMACPDVEGLPGNVNQVRAVATRIIEYCRSLGVCALLVGHVTKDGALAGPRLLEHMVDTVLSLEGDRKQSHRLMRVFKNRFGSSEEMLVFRMERTGMNIVEDPTAFFLEDRNPNLSGTAVVMACESRRPLAVEVQALCSRSYLSIPRRVALGFDANRLNLLLAVLEKRLKLIDDVLSDTALLLDYIVTCKEAGIISTKTAGIWSGKATDVKRMAAAWRKSSSQRAEAILREKQEAADRHTAEIVAKVAAETVRKALAEERAEVF